MHGNGGICSQGIPLSLPHKHVYRRVQEERLVLPYLSNGPENEAKLNLVTIFTNSDHEFWESLQFPMAKHYSRVPVQL